MLAQQHQELSEKIWAVANKLRGPYRPPQYRRVMLPMIVLRRLDCVLEPTKDEVLKQFDALKKKGLSDAAVEKALAKIASKDRHQPLYNVSLYTFAKLLGDANGLARNLTAYIKGFSPKVREIFEKFEFEKEIEKLDEANRLFEVVREFATIDLHPDRVDNIAMGYVFENLIRRFNEQANEEAGDHFTPREVIRLMAHLIYTGDEDIYEPGISRTVYDPACGTGGMLSVSEAYIREHNDKAHLTLFGQDYNAEAFAICCADMLIKDEPVDNIVHGDTLGDGKSRDGHAGKTFHYMMANPPFGVEWKTQQKVIEKEHDEFGFGGRFGPGLPRINDGALLFLLHMIAKRKPTPEEGGEGSKIAIVFNGSPLFTGDAGSGESNIRRWIIENDWLDAIVALPDQFFYNTGIYTYVWLVTNRKPVERRGKVLLIDATRHFQKMKKSLGNKRNELSEEHIREITRLYAEARHDAVSRFKSNGEEFERICSKIFDNRDFGYLKLTIERPLRLNFQASSERLARLKDQTAFANLAESRKRKDKGVIAEEEAEGRQVQEAIINALYGLDPDELYKNRDAFKSWLDNALEEAGVRVSRPVYHAILAALSERDPTADICTLASGKPEPDPELRDTESVPLPDDIELPLPIGYEDKVDNSDLVDLVRDHCLSYFDKEVKPHWPDAWIDFSKTKVGYEIPINRHFYVYEAPRPLADIERDIKKLEGEILEMLKEEKRLAVITQAVTKGLDPNALLKDSGIDWLGRIPAHWEAKRLRFVMEKIEQGWSPLCNNYPAEDDEWGVLKVGCVNGTTFDQSENKALPSDLAPREHYEISSGDILMSRANTKELLGSAAIVQEVRPKLLLCDKLYRLVVSAHIDRQFAVLALRSHIARFQYERAATGTSGSMQNIVQDTIKDVVVALPPLEEQRAIVAHLNTEGARIDRMMDANRCFIDVLEEYRSALITNAVTGKIDVRGEMEKEAAA